MTHVAITVTERVEPNATGDHFRCFIDEGVGHTGWGRTPAEAIMHAGMAWYHYVNTS